jgi:catechol 2,3-dioxygenase-like lactoylglutathione lyase family enzyme
VTERLVRKVDHIVAPVADPEPLFTLFTSTLGMPVAWPVTDRTLYRSGAFCAGNANVEFLTGSIEVSPFFAPTEPLTFRGVALEPQPGVDATAMLRERGIEHGRENTWTDDAGAPFVTNVFLSDLVTDAAMVFLCRYEGETALDRRVTFEKFAPGDNPLGVIGVAEVTIGVRDFDGIMSLWTRLLAPAVADRHGRFDFGEGAAIRLKRSPIDGVAGLWLEVASLAAARDALRERDLLGPMRASGIGLDYSRTGGLDVWLTGKP